LSINIFFGGYFFLKTPCLRISSNTFKKGGDADGQP
jgi:hypothetical protein